MTWYRSFRPLAIACPRKPLLPVISTVGRKAYSNCMHRLRGGDQGGGATADHQSRMRACKLPQRAQMIQEHRSVKAALLFMTSRKLRQSTPAAWAVPDPSRNRERRHTRLHSQRCEKRIGKWRERNVRPGGLAGPAQLIADGRT